MFLLKIIFQNSVSTCIKNICPLSILLLVSICIWWNRKFVVQSAGTEKKIGRAKWGRKFLECQIIRASANHVMCQAPTPAGPPRPAGTSHL